MVVFAFIYMDDKELKMLIQQDLDRIDKLLAELESHCERLQSKGDWENLSIIGKIQSELKEILGDSNGK